MRGLYFVMFWCGMLLVNSITFKIISQTQEAFDRHLSNYDFEYA